MPQKKWDLYFGIWEGVTGRRKFFEWADRLVRPFLPEYQYIRHVLQTGSLVPQFFMVFPGILKVISRITSGSFFKPMSWK